MDGKKMEFMFPDFLAFDLLVRVFPKSNALPVIAKKCVEDKRSWHLHRLRKAKFAREHCEVKPKSH